jgi:WD40 repeat protein
MWKVSSGKLVWVSVPDEGNIKILAFDPTGRILASSSYDDTIKLWDAATGQLIRAINIHNSVTNLLFDPTGSVVIGTFRDGTARLWQVSTGEFLGALMPLPEGWVAFKPAGRYRYSGNIKDYFWQSIGLCRFEPGELDEFMPDVRLAPNEGLWQVDSGILSANA